MVSRRNVLAPSPAGRIIFTRAPIDGNQRTRPARRIPRNPFRPDCDYINGEIQERNWGEEDHCDLQARLIELLVAPANKLHVRANPEIRVQVKPENFRVPDVCVRPRNVPRERFVRQPPLLCIEILSPKDTVRKTKERIQDFLEMGVPEVWLLDPEARSVTIYDRTTIVEHTSGILNIPGTPVRLDLRDTFSALDNYDQ